MLLWLTVPVRAAEVLAVRVTRHRATFVITMRLALDAPPRAIFAAMRDYAALPRYDPDLRRVHVEPTAEANRVRLFAAVHACVLIFCKTLQQEQIMTATPNAHGGVLRAVLVSGSGDFRAGQARWNVHPCPGRSAASCLDARIELRPAFWVPPVIGPWILRHKVTEQARHYGEGLEHIARHLRTSCAAAERPSAMPAYSCTGSVPGCSSRSPTTARCDL